MPGSRPRMTELARAYDLLWIMGVEVIAVPTDASPDAIRALGSTPPVLFPVVTDGAVDIVETYNPWCEHAANRAAAELAADLGKVTATGSDSHGLRELGRSWMEIEQFDGPDDFLHKLAGARHIVTSTSGTGRRA